MSKKFDPKQQAEYRIVEVAFEAISSVRIVTPIDFDLETESSELFPEFDLESEALKQIEARYPDISWTVHPTLENEFVDNLI